MADKSQLYGSADIEECREKGHRFQTTWSDKTPMKVSLLCKDCSEKSGNSTYVEYGVDTQSWGTWRRLERRPVVEPILDAPEED